jgi:hypothetical protein
MRPDFNRRRHDSLSARFDLPLKLLSFANRIVEVHRPAAARSL